jgi:energy-coupling factor transporter ATP-binding protein EcfA2
LLSLDAHITSISFKDGLEVTLKEGDILAIIGPNNSGKSTALSEIKGGLSAPQGPTHVISSVTLNRTSTYKELEELFRPFVDAGGIVQTPTGGMYISNLQSLWDDAHDRFAMRDLGSVRIDFQFKLQRIEKTSDAFILISSMSSLLSFLLVLVSVFSGACLTLNHMLIVALIVSAPVLCCGGLFIFWWDASRPLVSRCQHYYDQ